MKNKKILLTLSIVILTLVCLFVFCGCGEVISAYDIAVKNGFVGTEKEWLDTLHGTDGTNGLDGKDGKDGQDNTSDITEIYEEAKKNGFEGTFSDFLSTYVFTDKGTDLRYTVNKALLSSVSVISQYQKKDVFGKTIDYAGAGSGVIYKLDKANGSAYIITNYHVVYDVDSIKTTDKISDDIKVFLYGSEYGEYAMQAIYIGGSMNYDIAVLKISGSDILSASSARAVDYIDSNTISVGQTAIAFGNANGEGISATSGIVSVKSELIPINSVDNTGEINFRSIRMDTAINGGNSGGGLFDIDGNMIGIVNARKADTKIENISYAIPSNIAIGVAQNLIDYSVNGTNAVYKPILGIESYATTSQAKFDDNTGLTNIEQVLKVKSITPDSLSDGKVQADDILISATLTGKISGNIITYALNRSYVLGDLMLNARVGDTLNLKIERGGEILNVDIVIDSACLTVIK